MFQMLRHSLRLVSSVVHSKRPVSLVVGTFRTFSNGIPNEKSNNGTKVIEKSKDPSGDYFQDVNDKGVKIEDKKHELEGADIATISIDALKPEKKTDEYDDLTFYSQVKESNVISTDKNETGNNDIGQADSGGLSPPSSTSGQHQHREFSTLCEAAVEAGEFLSGYDSYSADSCSTGCDIFGSPLHGHCTHTYPSGDVYRGMWSNGERHGQGVMWGKDGSVSGGMFRCNKLQGHCEVKYPNGDRFCGQYVHGVRHGAALLTRSDGSVQTSKWVRGKMHSSREMGKDW